MGPRERRLSPRETARLQGFPDTFVFPDQPPSATYKQMGNGVNVGAVWHVFREHVRRDADLLRHAAYEDPARRAAKLAALAACEQWLFTLTWAQVRAPVLESYSKQCAEELALAEKTIHVALTESEAHRLNELQAANTIYEAFLRKITPTARRAELEQEFRQHEQARRAASHH